MFDSSHTDWEQLPGGPALAAALEHVEVGRLSGFGLVEVVKASERLRSWVTAVQCEAMAELAHCADEALAETSSNPHARKATVNDIAVDEIATALVVARPTAAHRLGVALDLVDRLPATLGELRSAAIHEAQARVICRHTAVLAADDAESRRLLSEVERRVLTAARGQTPGKLRAIVDRAVQRADPGAAAERHRRAESERRVEVWPQPDGMATLAAILPADQAHAMLGVVDDFARTLGSDDSRNMDARRADCLVDLVVNGGDVRGGKPSGRTSPADTGGSPSTGHCTAGRSRRPAQAVVHVTVPISTLMGVDDEPGDLAGHGTIPADLARRVAAGPDSVWRRLLTDPTSGTLLDYGTATYRPPVVLDRYVRIRDGTCRFPGCRQSAWRGDLDHSTPFPNGPTADHNLTGLCRHHHVLKTSGRWKVEHGAGAVLTWTSPTGHRYLTAPCTLDPTTESRRTTGH